MIYYKQEKFSLAEMHFQKALDINPQSSVLLCHIGVVSSFLYCSVNPFWNVIGLIAVMKIGNFLLLLFLKQYPGFFYSQNYHLFAWHKEKSLEYPHCLGKLLNFSELLFCE